MGLQSYIPINIDFYDKKYISINAKQYDKKSRFLLVTCYSHGELFHLNSSEHSAYIRYRKSDSNSVFNFCEINMQGKVLVELTEQMLACDGICYADLVIVNKGDAKVDTGTGEIVAINNSSVLSTMTFYIDVSETSTENSDIESSYEFNALNDALERIEANYSQVALLSKSYAVGNANGLRENEDTDNSKYYYELSLRESNEANNSKNASKTNANLSKSYAVGGTGVRANENKDNAYYYYGLTKSIVNGLNNGFVPMGTVSFSELKSVEKATGYIYNISNDFVTDSTFREGSGKSYTAGTNVYYTASGQWDCFGGASSPTATVNEVKEYLGI